MRLIRIITNQSRYLGDVVKSYFEVSFSGLTLDSVDYLYPFLLKKITILLSWINLSIPTYGQ